MPAIDFGFRELEIFCKVVELESFSKAAEAVLLAQASVSERIASLEHKVGVRLLDRLGRKVIPTAAGELLHKHATLILEVKQTTQLEMDKFLGLERGEISMGGSTIPGEFILPQCLGRFTMLYPNLTVNLAIGDSSRIEKRILAGELEIGVIGSKSRHPNLICQELWQDELVLAVSPSHPWARRKEVTVKELGQASWILREPGSGTLNMMDSYLREKGLDGTRGLTIQARLGSSTAVKEGIKSGLGLSILSKRAIQTEVEAGLLNVVKIRGLSMTRGFYLIRNKLRIASPACQAMRRFLLSTTREKI